MTYKMIIILLSAFCVLSIAIITINYFVLRRKIKKQVECAKIINLMAKIQLLYIKFAVNDDLSKYPNIDKVLNHMTQTFEKILGHADFDCKGIVIQKKVMPGLNVDRFAEEFLSCPHQLRKIVELNTLIVMKLSRIKRPALFWRIKIKVFISLLPVRLAVFFPNRNSKKRPKAEKKLIENIRQEIATVGIQ